MNAPCSISATCTALPVTRDRSAAQRTHDRARHHRHDDLAREAQAVIDGLAAKWTAWRREGE